MSKINELNPLTPPEFDGAKLAAEIRARGAKLAAFARMCGASRETVSAWVHGHAAPMVPGLAAAARVLSELPILETGVCETVTMESLVVWPT